MANWDYSEDPYDWVDSERLRKKAIKEGKRRKSEINPMDVYISLLDEKHPIYQENLGKAKRAIEKLAPKQDKTTILQAMGML